MTVKLAYQTAEAMQRQLGSGTPYVTRYDDGAVAHVELAEDITVDTGGERFRMIVLTEGFTGTTLEEAVRSAVAGIKAKAEEHRCEANRLDKLSATIRAAAWGIDFF